MAKAIDIHPRKEGFYTITISLGAWNLSKSILIA